MLVLSAIAAIAVGALVTLAFSQTSQKPAAQPSDAAHSTTPGALQIAAATRTQAAGWIKEQVLPGTDIECDALMCSALQAAGVSPDNLVMVQPTTPDPLGSSVVVATPAVRNQFGPRLAAVYAPWLIASFGTGAERIDIRYVAPGGTAAFEASLASARSARITAGEQLLANKHLQVSAAALRALMAGNVDWRLLVTLSLLAHEMPLHLVTFDDSSPGASSAVPLRGAEIGASTSSGLSAMLAFLTQQTTYAPQEFHRARIAGGKSVVTVQYDAPGWLGPNGP